MAKKEEELFQAWYEDVSNGLETEDEKKAFEIFANSKAGRETLRGGMRRQEFDKRLNTINETRLQLEAAEANLKQRAQEYKNWYEDEAPKNAKLVAELETLKSRLREATGDDPPPAASTAEQVPFRNEEFEKLKQQVAAIDKNSPRILGDMALIIKRSIKEDFDIDPREVMAYSMKHQVDPFRAYEDITHEARAARFQEERDAEIAKAREEGKKEALRTIKSSPDHIRTPGPSVVDNLQKGEAPMSRNDRISAAVRDFMELGSQA